MQITQVQDIASQKGYKFNNQFFVGYEGNSNFDPENADYLAIKEYIKKGGIVDPEYTPQELLQRAKDQKLAQLRINFNSASQKPAILKDAVVVNKAGKPIDKIAAAPFFIPNGESLTDPVNIVLMGQIQKLYELIRFIKDNPNKTFAECESAVYQKSDNFEKGMFLPYTTLNQQNDKIVVLTTFRHSDSIKSHITNRVVNNIGALNIKEELIHNATSIEELEKIDINI